MSESKLRPKPEIANVPELDRVKILLLAIDRKLDSSRDFFVTYKLIDTTDIMNIVCPRYDLLITLTKPNNITSPDHPINIEKKVTVYIRKLSRYGAGNTMLKYDNEEIQTFAKKLYFKLIIFYYDNLSNVDKILDSMIPPVNRTETKIFSALIDKFTNLAYMQDEEIKMELEKFEKESKEAALKSKGRHLLFF